jgi:hypothetical protein
MTPNPGCNMIASHNAMAMTPRKICRIGIPYEISVHFSLISNSISSKIPSLAPNHIFKESKTLSV